jgi:Sec-independent protein translocase protein TatA
MKTIILLTAILLTGCTSLNSVIRNDLTACLEAQKSMSRDSAMAEVARLNALQEIVKNANDQTKMAAMAQINIRQRQDIVCK